MELFRKKGTATTFVFPLVSSGSNSYYTTSAWTNLTNTSISAYQWSDTITPTSFTLSQTPTQLTSTGLWQLSATAIDMTQTGDYIAIKLKANEIQEQTILVLLTSYSMQSIADINNKVNTNPVIVSGSTAGVYFGTSAYTNFPQVSVSAQTGSHPAIIVSGSTAGVSFRTSGIGAGLSIGTSAYTNFPQVSVSSINVGLGTGSIWIDTLYGTTGTNIITNGNPGNPVNSWANALTVASATGIRCFNINPGSNIVFSASLSDYSFMGNNYNIGLGNQDISNTYFKGAYLSGNATCSGSTPIIENCQLNLLTIPPGDYNRCAVRGTLTTIAGTSANTAVYTFDQCYQDTANISPMSAIFTPYVDVGFRHGSGRLIIYNFSSTNNLSLDGNMQLTIDSSCNGGLVKVRGNVYVVDNSNGAITIDKTGDSIYGIQNVTNLTNPVNVSAMNNGVIINNTFGYDTVNRNSYAGTAISGTANSITVISNSAISALNYFDGQIVQIVLGTGIGQSKIISSTSSTGINQTTLLVSENWSVNPDNTSLFVIIPMGDVEVGVNNDKTGYNVTTMPQVQVSGINNGLYIGTSAYINYPQVTVSSNTNIVSANIVQALGQSQIYTLDNILDIVESQRGHHTVHGMIFYVDGLSGNDLTGTGTRIAPYATITSALGQCVSNRHDAIILVPNLGGNPTNIVEPNGLIINKNYVFIRGMGRDTTITRTTSGTTVTILSANGVEIEGCRISTFGTSNNALTINTSDYSYIHDVWLSGSTQDAIYLLDCANTRIEKNTITNTTRDAIRIDTSNTALNNRYNRVESNLIRQPFVNAVNLIGSNASYTRIYDNIIRDGGTGINIGVGISGTICTDNRYSNMTTWKIDNGTATLDEYNIDNTGTPVSLAGNPATIAGMLAAMSDGDGGSSFVSANSLKGIYNQLTTQNTAALTANGGSVIGGTNVAGSYLNTSASDLGYWRIRTSGSVPLSATLSFNLGVRIPNSVTVVGYLTAGNPTNGGFIDVYAYNYTTSAYGLISNAANRMANAASNITYSYILNGAINVNGIGQAQLLFVATRTNTSDTLNLDYVIVNAIAGVSVSDIANAVWSYNIQPFDGSYTAGAILGHSVEFNGVVTSAISKLQFQVGSLPTSAGIYDNYFINVHNAILGISETRTIQSMDVDGLITLRTPFMNSPNLSDLVQITTIDNSTSLFEGIVISATSTTITIDNSPVLIDDYYTYCHVHIVDGTGKGQMRHILVYTSADATCYIDRPWRVIPDNTSTFHIIDYNRELNVQSTGLVISALSNNITMKASENSNDNFYNNMSLVIRGGTGTGQTRNIISYNGTTKVAVIDRPWVVIPAINSVYVIMSPENYMSSGNFDSGLVTYIASGVLSNTNNKLVTNASGYVSAFSTNELVFPNAVTVSAYQNFPQVQVSGLNALVITSATVADWGNLTSADFDSTFFNEIDVVETSAHGSGSWQKISSINVSSVNAGVYVGTSAYTNFPQVFVSAGQVTNVTGNISGSVNNVIVPVTTNQVQVSGINNGLYVGTSAYTNFPQVSVSANNDKIGYTVTNPVTVSAYQNFPQVTVSAINSGVYGSVSAYSNVPQVYTSAGIIGTVTNVTNPVVVSAYQNFPQVYVSAGTVTTDINVTNPVTVSAYQNFPQVSVSAQTGLHPIVTVSAYSNFPSVNVSSTSISALTSADFSNDYYNKIQSLDTIISIGQVQVSGINNGVFGSVSAYQNFPQVFASGGNVTANIGQVQVSGINNGIYIGTSAYTNFPQVYVSAGTVTTDINVTNPVTVSAYQNFPQVIVSANLDKINYTVSAGIINNITGNISGSVNSVSTSVTAVSVTNPVTVSAYTNFPSVNLSSVNNGTLVSADFGIDYYNKIQSITPNIIIGQVQVSGINSGIMVGTSAYTNFPQVYVSAGTVTTDINVTNPVTVSAYQNFPQVTVSANLDKTNYSVSGGKIDVETTIINPVTVSAYQNFPNVYVSAGNITTIPQVQVSGINTGVIGSITVSAYQNFPNVNVSSIDSDISISANIGLVTVGTNLDKTGYGISGGNINNITNPITVSAYQNFPNVNVSSIDSDISISANIGLVTVGTNLDKTGYGISGGNIDNITNPVTVSVYQNFPQVTVSANLDKTNYSVSGGKIDVETTIINPVTVSAYQNFPQVTVSAITSGVVVSAVVINEITVSAIDQYAINQIQYGLASASDISNIENTINSISAITNQFTFNGSAVNSNVVAVSGVPVNSGTFSTITVDDILNGIVDNQTISEIFKILLAQAVGASNLISNGTGGYIIDYKSQDGITTAYKVNIQPTSRVQI